MAGEGKGGAGCPGCCWGCCCGRSYGIDRNGISISRNRKWSAFLKRFQKLWRACSQKDMPSMLCNKFTSAYLTMKKAEWVDFTSQVTPWEMEKTLDC